MRFAYQGLVMNELKGNEALPYGEEYLMLLGFNTLTKATCFYVTLIFMAFFACVSLLCLKIFHFEKR
jgi:hypothetical protein